MEDESSDSVFFEIVLVDQETLCTMSIGRAFSPLLRGGICYPALRAGMLSGLWLLKSSYADGRCLI